MSVILECPHCHVRLKTVQIPSQVRCPACKNKFKPVIELEKEPAESAPQAPPVADGPPADPVNITDTALAPRRLKTEPFRGIDSGSAKPTRPVIDAPPSAAKTDSDAPQINSVQTTESVQSSSLEITTGNSDSSLYRGLYPARPKKSILIPITSIVLAFAAIGSLFTIVAVLAEPENEPAAENLDAEKETEEKAEEESALDRAAKVAKQPVAPPVIPVDETPKYFTKRELEVAWDKVNGYMVRLEVRTPVTTRTISGTIVDSRGWVLTSLSGLEDAGEVTVTLAAKSLTDKPPFRELNDLARGIIATDESLDLALIAINRTQVINLADIQFSDKDRVVSAKRLLATRVPPARHQRWLAETEIIKRGETESLGPLYQSKLKTTQIDPALNLIVYEPRLPTNVAVETKGAALIDKDGIVQAISTGHTADGRIFAVPANIAAAFVKTAGSKPVEAKAFPRTADLLKNATAENGTEGSGVRETDGPSNEFNTLMDDLNEAFVVVRSTDWTAELENEFSALQTLSEKFFAAQSWLATNPQFDEQSAEHQKRFDEALEEMRTSLEVDLSQDEFHAGVGNKFFEQLVTDDNPWFIIPVQVLSDQINSPQVRGRDTVIFNLIGTEQHIAALSYAEAQNFIKGRRFLIFGSVDPNGSVNVNGKQAKIARVYMHFGFTPGR